MVGWLKTPQKVADFFQAKGHHRLVIRLADVFNMRAESQYALARLLVSLGAVSEIPENHERLKRALVDLAPAGYVMAPFSAIVRLTQEEAIELQGLMAEYRDVRRDAGFPSRSETCDCKGRDRRCRACAGAGKVLVLLEMDERERELAEAAE